MTVPTLLIIGGLLLVGGVGTSAYLLNESGDACAPGASSAMATSGGTGEVCASGGMCPDGDVIPFPQDDGRTGLIRIQVDNTHRAVAGSICVVDADGVKRHQADFSVAADATRSLDVPVPVQHYDVAVRFAPVGDGSGGSSTTSGASFPLDDCAGGSMAFPITVTSKNAHEIATKAARVRCV